MGVLSRIKALFGGGKSKLPRINVKERFHLYGKSGQGSMSKVWRAQDKKLGRVVCLKVLDKEKTAKFEARFQGLKRPTEGEICLLLHHKNVVQTFEHGMTLENEHCLVMEWIDGVGLNFLVDTKSTQLNGRRVDILLQTAEGLEYVHNLGFMHRDMCPRNLMVTPDGTVKLIDFGLAIPDTPDFRRPGNRTGTPNYLAPEVIKRQSTDRRVDMFALGVTAYELFAGGLPWEKTQSMQTLLSHVNSPGKHPSEYRPDLDEDVIRFLVKAIQRDRDSRFQTPAEFRDALKELSRQDW